MCKIQLVSDISRCKLYCFFILPTDYSNVFYSEIKCL